MSTSDDHAGDPVALIARELRRAAFEHGKLWDADQRSKMLSDQNRLLREEIEKLRKERDFYVSQRKSDEPLLRALHKKATAAVGLMHSVQSWLAAGPTLSKANKLTIRKQLNANRTELQIALQNASGACDQIPF